MFADAIRCSSATGGAATLTLSSVSGYPQITDAFGTSGTKMVSYAIAEYTDSTLTVLSKYEAGDGSLVLSTNVLTRSKIKTSWTGGAYNKDNPSAVTFGSTAANIVITIGGTSSSGTIGIPALFTVGGDIWQLFNTRCTQDSAISTRTFANGDRVWIPIEFRYGCAVTQVGIEITTAAASSFVRMGLYDFSPTDGSPNNLIKEFTSASQIDTSATGFRSITLATPFYIPQGVYWLCLQGNNSTVISRLYSHMGGSLIGSSGQRDIMFFTKGATYGALPAVGDNTFSTIVTRSAGGQPCGIFK